MYFSFIEVNFQFTNGEGKQAKLLPAAASFEFLVHFRPHTFHFVHAFYSTFDAHDTHSLRYNAMNELNFTKYIKNEWESFIRGSKYRETDESTRLLFRGVWNPWLNTKHEFFRWLLIIEERKLLEKLFPRQLNIKTIGRNNFWRMANFSVCYSSRFYPGGLFKDYDLHKAA